MINLPRRERAIAVRLEMIRQRDAILPLRERAKPRREPVDPGRRRPETEHEARARGIAKRSLAMRVEQHGAARREAVDIGRLRQRMSAESADPIVLIVDGDEDDVRLRRGGRREGGRGCGQQTNREQRGDSHFKNGV